MQKPAPVVLDEILLETLDSNDGKYDRRLEYGHYHPDQQKYPGYRLLKQGPNSYGQYQYTWGNSPTAQDSYNLAKKYSAASNSHLVFARSYRVLRSDYLVNGPTAKGTAFTGIVAIHVTNGGSGYASDFAISFSGGAGSGLTGVAIVNRGAVISVQLTNLGTGFTSAPTISFSNGSGTGAAATAVIQPTTALLVDEEHSKLPDDDPYSSLYDRVTRVYETLPGPWLPFTRYDDNLGPIQGQRRAVINTGQVSTLTSTLKTTYESRDGSSYVLWEIQEAFGAGVSGFTAYPIVGSSELGQEIRGRIVFTEKQTVAEGTSPTSGSLHLSSTVRGINAELAERTDVFILTLPPDEVYAYWEWVSLPLCILDIVNTYFCNNSTFFTVVTNPDTDAGAAVLRKHRKTISYTTTTPNTSPDLSGSAFETADLQYQGKYIRFSYSGALNDALTYDQDFYDSSSEAACFFTEAYSFPATTPSATTFLAGGWYTKRFEPVQVGQQMWKTTHDEYYSAAGNPSIS